MGYPSLFRIGISRRAHALQFCRAEDGETLNFRHKFWKKNSDFDLMRFTFWEWMIVGPFLGVHNKDYKTLNRDTYLKL